MISNPSVLNIENDKLIYTECINDKFVLNSNFGLKYGKESVFSPVFISPNEIAFETVIDRKPVKKILNIKTGESSVTDRISFQNGIISNNGNLKCFVRDGQILLEDLISGKVLELTSGRQINSYPRFAENDTKIIFCSDRSRGAGFTTLYQFDLKKSFNIGK
jgi:Tol biopolymer transport system component